MVTPLRHAHPLKNTVNTDTNAVFSESNFGAVSTDWKHKCKPQKIKKIPKSNNPKIQKSENPKIQHFSHLRNLAMFFGFFGFFGFLDFWIFGLLDFSTLRFLDFWILIFGMFDACILDL